MSQFNLGTCDWEPPACIGGVFVDLLVPEFEQGCVLVHRGDTSSPSLRPSWVGGCWLVGEIRLVGGSVTPEPLRRGGWVGLGDSPQSAMVGSSVRLQVCICLSTISIQTHGITSRLSFRRVRTRRLVQNSLYEPADSSGGSRTVWLETRTSAPRIQLIHCVIAQ